MATTKIELKNSIINLPVKESKPDFDFMESFIAELEAYLAVTGLKDVTLTDEEIQVLEQFEKGEFDWEEFNLKKLFGKSTRGKRLKSADRVPGNLPFITAGEASEGVSAFISNDVTIFPENTITIDMFGSAKYRNYKYGGDDHIAVVHTEKLPKLATIFLTSAIHTVSNAGQFDYGRNFYAKDADDLVISLPSAKSKPDYSLMGTLI